MKKKLRYILLAAILSIASSCGLKNPLYFSSVDLVRKKPATLLLSTTNQVNNR